MSLAETTVVVIAKEPLPGRCKTRLSPPLEPAAAARLAAAALGDTLAAVSRARVSRRVLLLEGAPGSWIPPGFELIPQAHGDLGARLEAGFAAVGGPALVIGMDTPQLGPGAIEGAAAALWEPGIDAVLGPALDGGYWAIGLREPRRGVFDGVAMSTPRTAELQRLRLAGLGLRVSELEPMRDFDTIEDARLVAATCPRTTFARTLSETRWIAAA